MASLALELRDLKAPRMQRLIFGALALCACSQSQTSEHYGFVARLGNDTISVESVTRRGNTITSDEADRFPRVRQRHTEIVLAPDGGIQHLVMDVTTPSEPPNQRERHIVADVTKDSVLMVKSDKERSLRWSFGTGGATVMAHVPQMYSLYEVYLAAGAQHLAAKGAAVGDTARFRQFYIDRDFDRFPLHTGNVRRGANGKLEIFHDWLAGIGEATLDSNRHLLHYSGARTTYLVEVERVSNVPDIKTIGAQFASAEAAKGGAKQLSVRDTTRASIGAATFTVDYGRPLARGRELLGNVIPYDEVWRTGANAATQFTTSAPITLAGMKVAAGAYTLWTIPHAKGVDLIVNKQTGQWGTGYDGSQDLAKAPMATETQTTPVEEFTISVKAADDHHGTLIMEWGPFRWSAAITVLPGKVSEK